jgi:hypothetical protein
MYASPRGVAYAAVPHSVPAIGKRMTVAENLRSVSASRSVDMQSR